jgi:flagellar basal body-associated protein FliL
MRFTLHTIVNFILFIIFAIGIVVFVFWRFGVLKKEAEVSEKISTIKNQLEYVKNYPYDELSNYFQNLPVTKIEIPDLKPEELNRPSLF